MQAEARVVHWTTPAASMLEVLGMGALSPVHLIIILAVAPLVIGPNKLPETGAPLGKAVHDFRHAMADNEAEPDSTNTPSAG